MGSRQPNSASAHAPRALPAVSVSVSVEETSSSKTTYDSTMLCLKSPTSGSCKKTPKFTLMIKTAGAGRRQLSGAKQATTCLHGGAAVTCDDKVHNGDELMTDCGGSCESRGAADVAQCASAAVAMAAVLGKGTAGRFNITTPYNLSKLKPTGARCKLAIPCRNTRAAVYQTMWLPESVPVPSASSGYATWQGSTTYFLPLKVRPTRAIFLDAWVPSALDANFGIGAMLELRMGARKKISCEHSLFPASATVISNWNKTKKCEHWFLVMHLIKIASQL